MGCTIGPVSITNAQLYDADAFSVTRSVGKTQASNTIIFQKGVYGQAESFTIITEIDKALQLKGLVEIGEPVWIDTSSEITDNDYFQHKGWYLLTAINFSYENLELVQCEIDVEFISSNENEYLTMDYSRGIYDGLSLDHSYKPVDVTTLFSDSFSTYDTSKWSAVQKGWWYGSQGTSIASVASDGSELVLTTRGYANVDYSAAWVRSLQKFYPPFTVETVLDRRSLPSSGVGSVALGISKEVMQEGSQGLWKNGAIEWWYAQWAINPGSTNFELAFSNQGSWRQMYPWTDQGTTNEELKLKVSMDANANIVVTIANGTGGVFGAEREIYRGPSGFSNPSWGFYLYPYVYRDRPVNYSASFQYLNVTKDVEASIPYVVTLPYGASGNPTATGNRVGEDGNIPYYTNPTTEIRFKKPSDLYKGSVKLLSTNNDDSVSRQVYSTDYRLTPDTTILKNAFTALAFKNDGFDLYGWYNGQPNLINSFTVGQIDIIKPLLINHDKVVLQVNDMKIEMLRSSPMVTLKHPNTSISYNKPDGFFNDGVLNNSISPGDVITMNNLSNGYYAYTTCLDNKLPANIATGSDSGTTGLTGMYATVTSSTEWAANGTKSWKVVTNDTVGNKGTQAHASYRTTANPGETWSGSVKVYGTTGIVKARIGFKDESYGTLVWADSVLTTLDGTTKTIQVLNKTAPVDTKYVSLEVRTDVQASITFYADEFVLVNGDSIPAYTSMDLDSGGLDTGFRMIIGKKDPTSIYSDSIPASDYTGLGWYEKTLTGTKAADSLVKQWWKQTHTGISFKQIV